MRDTEQRPIGRLRDTVKVAVQQTQDVKRKATESTEPTEKAHHEGPKVNPVGDARRDPGCSNILWLGARRPLAGVR